MSEWHESCLNRQQILYPLSSVQREIWFEQSLYPDTPIHNIGGYITIKGKIDPQLFIQATTLLVQETEILRMVLTEQDGVPLQSFPEMPQVNSGFCDYSNEPDPLPKALSAMQQAIERPFQLFEEPLFVYTLYQLSEESFVWSFTYHHLIVDGRGNRLITQRIADIYNAQLQKASLPVKPGVPYADFIANDTAYLESADFDRHQHYWQQKFATLPEPLLSPLAGHANRPEIMPGATHNWFLSRTQYAQLEALAQSCQLSIFHALLGLLYVYFSRVQDTDECVIGIPVLNRRTPAFKQSIGLFASSIPIRCKHGHELSFIELMRAIARNLRESYRSQRFPASEINKLAGVFQAGRKRLFDISLSFDKYDHKVNWGDSSLLENGKLNHGYEQAPLALYVGDSGDKQDVQFEFSYNLAYFTAEDISNLQQRFICLLDDILANPEQPISHLNILPDEEKQQLLIDWNATATPFVEECVHRLFEAQVKATPQAIAVVFENETLTYDQLNTRANQLAHHLNHLGVAAETLVAIALERSPAMIVALLAVLKAGGAYVPLDPEYPADRLTYMLEDCGARILITQESLREKLPRTAAHALCIDGEWMAIAEHPQTNPDRLITPEQLAYVIYTSGSTGKPKGVAVEQRSIALHCRVIPAYFELTPKDRVFQFSSFSFDASLEQILPTLCAGAAIVLPAHRLLTSETVDSFVQRHRVTVLDLPPAFFSLWSATHRVDAFPLLRLIVLGGDVLPPQALETRAAWPEPKPRFLNAYGPTEATITSTFYEIPESLAGPSVPIGRPLAGRTIYILDRHNQPTPIGIPGELHIGGAGLARGYLNRPELTAEKFIPDPFSDGSGARLYKTGDLVRYRADGNIEFLGRLDHQVKIRGFRIELGEIEAALTEHPNIREAVVVARTEESCDKHLVAYLVADWHPDTTELRSFLRLSLPDYMLPAVFMFLDALPLTPNGKIDRKALPGPEAFAARHETVAPRNALEEIITGLWATILRQPHVGIHDNFFELGGHSLLATQLASRLRDAFAVEVPVRWLFEAPTVAELAARIRPLSTGAMAESAATEVIPPAPRNQPLPLSFAQQRLWFLDQLDGASATYNMAGVLELRGELDLSALTAAFSEIVRRHEALRTCLVMQEGKPLQHILPARPLDLPVIDLRSCVAPQAEASRLAHRKAITPFDLAGDLPLRVQLLHLEESAWKLLLTLHHSAADGWSIGILIRELSALYSAFREGEASPLPELPIQYADFALWQRNRLTGQRLQQQTDYWKTVLSGVPDCLNLPTDRPRPPRQSYRGGSVAVSIDQATTTGLMELGRRSGATLFMTLLAAWGNLLARYSGEQDIVIGSPVANRTHSAIEPLIGFFVNTLALRTNLSGNPTFLELLARTRQSCLEAYAHQELPFETLVEALNVTRNLAHAPLFQVMFVLQNNVEEVFELPGLDIALGESQSTLAKFDLTLSVTEIEGTLAAHLEYASDLFNRATVERMCGHFQELLNSIVADPEQPISHLNILPTGEKQQLLIDWNATTRPFSEECVHQLFEVQVRATPQATAVVFENESLTYDQLNTQANQLAHHLIKLGIKADNLVAIALERSPAMIVALLAVLKAGGAYVPLDPEYPAERLAYMLEDCGAHILITQENLRAQLPQTAGHTLCIDSGWTTIADQPQSNPDCFVSPDNLAYVIYTSGSTGKPKGVAIERRSIASHVRSIQNYFKLTSDDRVLQFASLSFDASIEQILPTLCSGAAIVLPAHGLNTPDVLNHTIKQHQVTLAHLPPAFFEQWLFLAPFCLTKSSLRLLQVGGDILPKRLVSTWSAFLQTQKRSIRLLNGYGPTEATITTTFFEIPETLPGNSVPIGRPLPDRTVYILDRHNQPTPIGVPGELHIGGATLARGYLNRPELTAEKFIPDPFSDVPGARLYKTGDLVRYRADGNIEFLERLDHQVKIRGFRIELGEIEAALAGHPDIREVVVAARSDETGDKRLVAYLVASDTEPGVAELRAFLKLSLPDYMLPAAFIYLDTLPLTSNGKIDRKALPGPEAFAARHETVAPRNALEEIITGLWATILRQPHVGIHDNFFELGGHSLLATQLASRLRDAFAVEVPVRWLFEAPTVGELAARIRPLSTGAIPESTATEVIPPAPRNQPLPLSFAQQRLWFLDQLDGASATYNMPGVLKLRGELDLPALTAAFSEIIRRHEALRTCLILQDGEAVQHILPARPLDLPVMELRSCVAPQAEASRLAHREAITPFDLAGDLPLRVQLLHLEESAWKLLLTLHHSAADGWSIGILIRELSALYSAYRDGNPSPLPELPIQYADFALWQRNWLTGKRLQQQTDYWKTVLSGVPDCLNLPTDRPRPPRQSYRGGSVAFSIDQATTTGLMELGRRSGATLFMTLLAAWGNLLARYSGEQDIVIGSPVANRTHSAIEALIGFFVNTLALRTDLSGNPTFLELLARTRQSCLEAYAHQELPFESLVGSLNVTRNLAHAPLFQVMFVLQNNLEEVFELPGLDITFSGSQSAIAKFDLTLSMTETDEGMEATLEYASDLFDRTTVERMSGHFTELLNSIVADPEQPISHLNILPAGEKQQLLIDWNATTRPFSEECVHQLFEAQVRATPQATAVVFENESLSYDQLNTQANQLAHHLIGLGIKADGLVVIALERSPAMIVALLAVLKAGGSYVPLDPEYPADRLSYMLEDCGARILLTQERLRDQLPQIAGYTLCIDGEEMTIAQQPANNPNRHVAPDNRAYVIYTSGSTGKPKGVAVEQRGLHRLARAQSLCFGITPKSRVLQFASISFDASISEIMITLCFGAALYFPNTEQRQPGTPLWQYLEENAISHITLPPTALAVMPQQPLQKLTHLIVAGEPCPPALAKYWSTGRRFFNAYGPTETTVCATIAECAHADIDADAALPIGRPIANTQIYILDRYNQPTPIGVPGELYIGGAGLARGYLNRPELTAEKFIPDPFSHDPGARLYKTGDRVRYRPDGNIEFLGRIDHQVKIRGFRIELGEIEAVLAGHLDIRETVVVARTEKTGDKRLVAYLVADGQPNPTELRDFLKLSLPDYMLPSAFVYLDDLPLTPNGKVDRKALPEPEICSPRHDSVAPRDAIEQQLIQIWEHLLSVHPIGVEDNFFEIGGHSLLAIRLVAKINKRFDKSLPVSQIFAYPTIAGIASRLRKGLELPEASCLVKIRPQGSRSPLFFLPGVEGTVSYLYPLAQQLNPDIPFFAFQAKGLDRKSSPYTTMEEMAGHFVELLLEVQPQGPYFLAGHSFGGRIAFAMAQILLTRGQIIGQLTIVDAIAPGMVAENSAPLEVDGQLLLDFFTIAGLRLKLSREEFKKLSTEEQLACAVRLLEEAHLLPEGGGIEYLDGLLDVHKANLQIHNQYAPEAPGLLPITLLRASETMADQIPIQGVDEDLGWGRYAHQPVAVHYMPGDHITMMRPPHVGQLAQSLGNTQVTLTCEQHLNACSTVAI